MRPESYQTTQEEADTLVAFRAALSNGNVLVRASDADVLVILLHLVSKNVIRKLWIIVRFSWIVVFEPPGDTSMLIKSTQNLNKPMSPASTQAVVALRMLSPVQITHLHFTTKVSCQPLTCFWGRKVECSCHNFALYHARNSIILK